MFVQHLIMDWIPNNFQILFADRISRTSLGMVYPITNCIIFLPQTVESELICSTAYVELFLRQISEPALLAVFLRFIFTDSCDAKNIIDTLTERISSQSQVSHKWRHANLTQNWSNLSLPSWLFYYEWSLNVRIFAEYNGDLNTGHPKTRNICIFSFFRVWYLHGNLTTGPVFKW